jgi:hypothetical protein
MRFCESLNGITRTMPRGSFEQTEFLNRLDCRNRGYSNPRLWKMLRRTNLIQRSQNDRAFHVRRKAAPRL